MSVDVASIRALMTMASPRVGVPQPLHACAATHTQNGEHGGLAPEAPSLDHIPFVDGSPTGLGDTQGAGHLCGTRDSSGVHIRGGGCNYSFVRHEPAAERKV